MTGDNDLRPRVVAVGLGPAGPEHTTRAAIEALSEAPVVLPSHGQASCRGHLARAA